MLAKALEGNNVLGSGSQRRLFSIFGGLIVCWLLAVAWLIEMCSQIYQKKFGEGALELPCLESFFRISCFVSLYGQRLGAVGLRIVLMKVFVRILFLEVNKGSDLFYRGGSSYNATFFVNHTSRECD